MCEQASVPHRPAADEARTVRLGSAYFCCQGRLSTVQTQTSEHSATCRHGAMCGDGPCLRASPRAIAVAMPNTQQAITLVGRRATASTCTTQYKAATCIHLLATRTT